MKLRSLLFAIALPVSSLCQQLDAVKFMGQFSQKGNEILPEYSDRFFDPFRPKDKKPKGRINVESKAIPFGPTAFLLIVSASEQDGKTPKRQYLLSLVNKGVQTQCMSIVTDTTAATFEKVADDILIFTGIEKGKPRERVITIARDRAMEARIGLTWLEYLKLSNRILAKSSFKISDGDALQMAKDKEWGALKLKRLLAADSITGDLEKVLQLVIHEAPRFRPLTSTAFEPSITTKGAGQDVSFFYGRVIDIDDEPTPRHDTCYVNMDGIPLRDGNVIGVTRYAVFDKGPKVTHHFAWFSGDKMGKALTIESGSKSLKQPYPEVTLVADRFIKIVSRDSQGKPKTYYAVYSDCDLLFLADVPKDEMPFHRNYVFARYGYKFKNAVYQNYFGVFDWYKPEHDDAAMVTGKLMTADEREIVTQLAELEKTAK